MGKGRAWLVAWRTMHHRLGRAVGEIEGRPMYSIDDIKVVLPPGSHHFRRVVDCAGCGTPVIDRNYPVYHRRYLDADTEVMCDACADIPMQRAAGQNAQPGSAP